MRATGWEKAGIALVLIVGFLGPTLADDRAIPAGAKAAFGSFVSAWLKEDVGGVVKTFPESEKVRIDVDDYAGSYSKEQVTVILKKYFEKIKPVKLELHDGKYSGNAENPIAQYDYEYIDEKTGQKITASLLLSCQKIGGGWVIKHVSKSDRQE